MMHMGFMFPGLGIFSGVFLVPIVLAGLFFGIKFLQRGMGIKPRQPDAPSIQQNIMRLAKENGGELTVTDVVLATGLSIKQAEETLNEMVDGFRIKMDVKDSGLILYEFSEIVSKKGGT